MTFAQYVETVRDTKVGTNFSNKMLLNAAKYQVTAVTVLELLRENQQGVEVKLPPTQIRVK